MNAGRPSLRALVAISAVVIVLAGAATIALAAANGAFRHGWVAPERPMLGTGPARRRHQRQPDQHGRPDDGRPDERHRRHDENPHRPVNVPAGTVSFRVANTGSLVHELVVLPLPAGQSVGSRAVGTDGRVDETGSVVEASNSCGPGAGDGINPGTISWVTVNPAPGTYELVCNLPGHYAAGMYTKLTVS